MPGGGGWSQLELTDALHMHVRRLQMSKFSMTSFNVASYIC
jgi:hypothetical protein